MSVLWFRRFRVIRNYLEYEVQTIFLGGGTPVSSDTGTDRTDFNAIYHTFSVNENAEITMK